MLVRGDINSYSMEKRYYTRNGDVVWALLAVSLVRHKDNQPSILSPRLKILTISNKASRKTNG